MAGAGALKGLSKAITPVQSFKGGLIPSGILGETLGGIGSVVPGFDNLTESTFGGLSQLNNIKQDVLALGDPFSSISNSINRPFQRRSLIANQTGLNPNTEEGNGFLNKLALDNDLSLRQKEDQLIFSRLLELINTPK